jgi:hypothetical protein
MRGCTFFTKFNIQWGYNNIHIKDGDQWKAAFLTHKGLFESMVIYFRLTNSPTTFQTMIDTIFAEEIAKGWLIVYIDNMHQGNPPRLPSASKREFTNNLDYQQLA